MSPPINHMNESTATHLLNEQKFLCMKRKKYNIIDNVATALRFYKRKSDNWVETWKSKWARTSVSNFTFRFSRSRHWLRLNWTEHMRLFCTGMFGNFLFASFWHFSLIKSKCGFRSEFTIWFTIRIHTVHWHRAIYSVCIYKKNK